MIRLKDILLEEDPKKPSEDPTKMLVRSKESGQSYYISKDNFDPAKHDKVEPRQKKKKKEEPKSSGGGGGGLMAKLKAAKEKASSTEKEEEKEDEEKETPEQKLEKKLGSFVFVDEKQKEEIADDTKNMRPDLKEKLLKFEFTSFFREYDALLDTLSTQYNTEDKEGSKETLIQIRRNAKRIQGVAIAKLAALSTFENDPLVTSAAKMYHNDSLVINSFLREGGEINWDKDELEKIIRDPKNRIQQPMKWRMYNILVLDEHFKSEGARLSNNTVVYRGVKKELLQKFIQSGEWVDNGFVSTSLNPIIAEDFTDKALVNNVPNRVQRTPIFKINLKRGDKVLMLPCSEDQFCIESEITLPRGCKFTITSKDEKRNIYEVSVEYPDA